nr:BTAD domain-containing putative transcriptional regulator [Streptomyces sp. SID8379]
MEVRADGQDLAIGGARQRTVLALLLLGPGRIVPVDTLVDAVWNSAPPATARTQIAIVVAALRKTFKAAGVVEDVIVTAHPGYVLRPERHTVDATEFAVLVARAEQDVRQGRLTEAGDGYRTALALWRGPALAGIATPSVEDEASRLEELRLNAYDDATAVQLELGNHQDLVPELGAVVREQPLRERTRHHLMLAQYRSGRRAEAMATFREARELFVEELGMDPGPDLQELHDAILRDDPSLAPAPPVPVGETRAGTLVVPSELPPDIPGFTGRGAELDALDGLVAGVDGVQGGTVGVISGIAGVGKTGLAVRWAHRATAHFPDGRLFADLRGYDEEYEPTRATEVIGRFLRSMGVPGDEIPQDKESLVALYRSVLADRRVLLVLDNVRSYDQVEPLLPGTGSCTVLVTSREQLEEVVAWPQRARVLLGVLPSADAVELIGRVVGEERVAAARVDTGLLADLCDRLPLALRIAAARLASKPHWSVRHLVARLADERRRLDELSQGASRVRASFGLSYRYLPDEAALLFRQLGLLDVPDFTAWVGAALLDTDQYEAERLMEDLVDAQFLEVVGVDGTGQLRYRLQNLLRLYARERAQAEDTEGGRRAAQERAFSGYLTIAEEAYRRERGGYFGLIRSDAPRRTAEPLLLDELLDAPLEWLEVERLSLVAAIVQAARLGMDEFSWGILAAATVLFDIRNYVDDSRVCSEAALAACRATGHLRGQAAVLHHLGAAAQASRRLDEAHAHYSEAVRLCEQVGEETGRASSLRNLAMVEEMRGDLDTAMKHLDAAVEVFRENGDHPSEASVLTNMAQIELERGNPELALTFADEAVGAMRSVDGGSGRGLAQAVHRLGQVHLAKEEYTAAETAFIEVADLVKAKSDMVGLAYATCGLGESHLGAGDLDAAERVLGEALEVAARIHDPRIDGQIHLALGRTLARQKRIDAAREQLNAAHDVFVQIGSPLWIQRTESELKVLDAESAS